MTINQWISVKDRLPNTGEYILCFESSYGMFVAQYNRHKAYYNPGYFDSWDSGHCCGREPPDPTHWMPLPASPEGIDES